MRKKTRKRNVVLRSSIISILAVSIVVMIALSIYKVIELNTSNTKKYNYNKVEVEDNINKDNINDDKEINNEIKEEEKKTDNSGYLSLENDPNAEDAKKVEKMLTTWDYLREDGKKIAYLTFDDGPSDYVTPEILDVLKRNNVKATFFVLGSVIEKNDNAKTTLKRIVAEGHAIGNHGYCHKYEILYPNRIADTTVFMNDMKKSEKVMKSVLGDDFHTRVIRFPGGHNSWNTDVLDLVLDNEGYAYIDWNTLNGDAEGHDLSTTVLHNRLEETIADLYGNDDTIVVLMHDTDAKKTTAQALQGIIDYLNSLGYEFKTLK